MIYIAETDITFDIPLVDSDGNPFQAVSISYSLLDGDGKVLLPSTTLEGYTVNENAAIVIVAYLNTLAVTENRAARQINLLCFTVAGTQIQVVKTYVIELPDRSLLKGINTFATLATANMLAEEMPTMKAWATATNRQKSNALIESYRRLGKLRIGGLNYNDDYVYVGRLRVSGSSFSDLSAAEILALDAKLLLVLAQAQVAEADEILSGDSDSLGDSSNSSVASEQIGEVKKTYNGKLPPIRLPVSRKALSYISAWTNISVKRVGRG